ncbi:hypothetical protein pb186bvf_006340 [Paramecium bursaria]
MIVINFNSQFQIFQLEANFLISCRKIQRMRLIKESKSDVIKNMTNFSITIQKNNRKYKILKNECAQLISQFNPSFISSINNKNL